MPKYYAEIHEPFKSGLLEFVSKKARDLNVEKKLNRKITKESLWVKNLSGAPGISFHANNVWVDYFKCSA